MPATVRVRIAVVVNDAGKWCANAWNDGSTEDFLENCTMGLEEGHQEATYFVECDIPIPQAVAGTVQGIVTPEGK